MFKTWKDEEERNDCGGEIAFKKTHGMGVAGRANRIGTAPDIFLQTNHSLPNDCKCNEFCFVPNWASCESQESIMSSNLGVEAVHAAGRRTWTAAKAFPFLQEKIDRG